MPNWVSNNLRIRAQTSDQLDAFLARLRGPAGADYPAGSNMLIPENAESGGFEAWLMANFASIGGKEATGVRIGMGVGSCIEPLGFHHLIPVPGEVIQAGYANAGRAWQRENWGTQWAAHDIEVKRESDREALFNFQTAWAPPVGVWVAMCELAKEDPFVGVDLRLDVREEATYCGYFEQLFDPIKCEWLCSAKRDDYEIDNEHEDAPYGDSIIGPSYAFNPGFGSY